MISDNALIRIKAIPVSREAYLPYGNLIEADESLPYRAANMGSAKRFNHLCNLENLRGDKAKLNLCVFRVSPLKTMPLELKLLEKHEYSTQVFMPMTGSCKYLAIVCLGKEDPELESLRAFVVKGPRGVSYYPGVWHYPMTALDQGIDFSCLVYENGSQDDCRLMNLEKNILIEL